ncbi:MAG: diaminopimelate decarboxylase [Paracoccaceae bacterium]|jgi:diaminopimelate decarboxylase
MDSFTYKDGELFSENVSVSKISSAVGSPFYLYSASMITQNYLLFKRALSELNNMIFFSVKANSNLAVLKLLGDMGAGMDVVSGGEYLRAKASGVLGDRIIFSGVGKTREEISVALKGGIRQFNVESENELIVINEVALSLGEVAPVTLRVNPDVDAKTHEKISTGKKENKFGIPIESARDVYKKITDLKGLKVVGVDVHIGSQLVDLEPFRAAFKKIAELTAVLREDGHEISRLDLGGGLGIEYKRSNSSPPTPYEYGLVIAETVGHLGCEIQIEPGRFIVGNAGILVSEIIYVKSGVDREFLILNSAMNDLIRPALYQAHHEIVPILEPNLERNERLYDVVGPVCETGDTFATQRMLPKMIAGDLIAFRSVGAYGAVMASEYNSRPLVPEVMVKENEFSIIRARPNIEDIIRRDIIPAWL